MTSWPNIPKGMRRAVTAGKVHWRVYGDGREFGRDYPTLEAARQAKARYAAEFPSVRYVIRRVRSWEA